MAKRAEAVGVLDTPAVARLRQMRWRLTAAYSLASAIGLAALALVVTVTDARLRDDAMLADADRLGTLTWEYLDVNDDDSIDTERLTDSGVLDEADVYLVAPARDGAAARVTYRSPGKPFVAVTDDQVVVFAADSLGGINNDNFAAEADGGHPVYVAGNPVSVEGSDDVLVSAVTVIDAQDSFDEHRQLLVIVWSGVVLLTLFSAGVGTWLAGRSLRPSLESLRQQERFLADAAHELRTPLAALRTTIEAGQLAGADSASSLARAEAIAAETSATVDDLLLLARMDAGADVREPDRVRLDLLVDEVLLDFPTARAECVDAVITADVALVRRAIRNLVANAFRHGGGIDVVVRVGIDPTRSVAWVSVQDGGPGIEPSVADTMFDRFVTGRRSTGSGLGMAIVREIATLHGGTIEARNRTDRTGAEVVLTLPLG